LVYINHWTRGIVLWVSGSVFSEILCYNIGHILQSVATCIGVTRLWSSQEVGMDKFSCTKQIAL